MPSLEERAARREDVISLVSYQLGRDYSRIINLLERIMAAIDDLRTELASVKAVVVADRDSDAAVVAAMQAEIDRLTGLIGTGLTPDQVTEVIASLEDIKNSVANTTPPTP